MIDFRYHLVSLVAVFIALAVGIALGAGPLREGLSATLESEVSQLREERLDLRAQVDAASRRAEAKDEAIEGLAAAALPGTLDGVRVAVVTLPGADRNALGELEDRLESAGADLVLTAELAERAGDEEPSPELGELLTALSAELADPPTGDGSGPSLATVLAATLSGADEVGHAGAWLRAADALEQEGVVDLTWRDGSSVEISDRRPADVLVLETGGLTAQETTETAGAEQLGLRLELVRSLAELQTPLVVAGTGAETVHDVDDTPVDPLVTAVRQDRDLADSVSTVDNLDSVAGQVATAMASAWALAEQVGHYGVGELSGSALPPVPPQREVPTSTIPAPGDTGLPTVDDGSATTAAP
ncbi:copper transporter [Ornithinimicrobium tianjinense]|uniref:Copper transport outer membrane protein, MctB n=1 Tax=Ornithinimicrobium tianjinense TaxID=1195761 RepID=A0A917F3A1_9MICO|nr:copper transporter [Ornithinimicrobium tianjinense]GGF48633.1 hypothetical protein GCM10011366_15620 [Ornithinimicrobium tianjinense]